jgi:RNA polymerase sigma-70 factor (ECF subfamily)
MPESDPRELSVLIDRLRAGDGGARDELIRVTLNRLERLTRKMLRGFPVVRRWEDTGDVLQNALIRLDRALRTVTPDSTRAFFGLAAEQIRRELIDLARHYRGPRGPGRAVRSVDSAAEEAAPEPADGGPTAAGLDRWTEFHAAVEHLPAEDREVFMLTFYHGWPQAQIAALFHVDERTVRRRWRAACLALTERLGGDLPTF